MRAFTAIVNPAAGGSASASCLIPLARLLREAGAELDVEYSRSMEHAAGVARGAAEAGRVVLGVGGDGMVGCVGGALAGTDAVFGIVPAGRGNDFARQLGARPARRSWPRCCWTASLAPWTPSRPTGRPSSAASTRASTRSPTTTPTRRGCCAARPPTTWARCGRSCPGGTPTT
ncbi:diacylglycerol kinase family protein [Actinomadura sp. BRA 177]|uniref:diacylglycerol/lipid kinase family protein n=1 Tax=Actinomadura sp. BRA 177 TaxID=2745202 RepID=UPI0020CBBA22|nr:acylglycerol kinase family protein [Actinomadura sp. BRA 177]